MLMGCGDGDRPPPAASQSPAQLEPGELEITATEYEFALTTPLPARRYDFTLINRGEEPHHAQFFRLAEGVTFERYRQVILSAGARSQAVRDLVVVPPTGVLAPVSPGERGTGRGDLRPGVYALVCLVGTSNVGHYQLGMSREVRIV